MAYDQKRHTELSIKKAAGGLSQAEEEELQELQKMRRMAQADAAYSGRNK